jgi:hypothetical protein
MTPAIAANGRPDAACAIRQELHGTTRTELISAVEGLTGCRVAAFMSDSQATPDMPRRCSCWIAP